MRLAKRLQEEACKREKIVGTFREEIDRLRLECLAYKQIIDRMKKELDEERTKYAPFLWECRELTARHTRMREQATPASADYNADNPVWHINGHCVTMLRDCSKSSDFKDEDSEFRCWAGSARPITGSTAQSFRLVFAPSQAYA